MNLLDAEVTRVLSAPYEKYDKWWVDVEYTCWGSNGETTIMTNTEEEALQVEVGHGFLM